MNPLSTSASLPTQGLISLVYILPQVKASWSEPELILAVKEYTPKLMNNNTSVLHQNVITQLLFVGVPMFTTGKGGLLPL